MRKFRGGLASRPILCLLLFFLLTSVQVSHVAAQAASPNAPTPANTPNVQPTKEAPKTDQTKKPLPGLPSSAPTETQKSDNTNPPTTAAQPTAKSSDTQRSTKGTPSSQSLPGLTTESSSPTDTATSSSKDTLVLPSLTGAVTIPTPQVPPKEGAPYLAKSNLPEGTIFIAVGAALGVVGLAVIAWRVLVAWSINRSVRRAANNIHHSDATALLHPNTRKSGLYQQTARASVSTEKMNKDRHSRVVSTHTPNQSLFFSPTAGASMHTAGNRASGYLPAGYYSASSATPGGGSGLTHLSTSTIGLSPMGPQAQGYSRTRSGPSPPSSPGLPPSSRGHDQAQRSTSSLNLSAPPQGRAPSAYLEDLFENHAPGR
ncbi:hypothetical protein PRK78_005545 [Emydomyces testavorans]|uniref:Mid2 domain-containing protein n=1 Tax=Emydomyces testavorans TaxID=2070801 RepID=A0AAF0DJS5_9EURO|nr:hypothetical protein PRK78_005545 [Emydomyces testavorans]